MRAGELLAMDTPHRLRGEGFSGKTWNIHVEDTLKALAMLENNPGVQRVNLASDFIRAITDRTFKKGQFVKILKDQGFQEFLVETSDPNLEDVFLSLARG